VKEKPLHQPLDKHEQHPELSSRGQPKLQAYLEAMVKAGASDLHIKPDCVPHVRLRATIHPTQAEPLAANEIAEMAAELMTEKQAKFFEETGNIDVAHELSGSDRFRINIYRQRGYIAMAVRRVLREIPDFKTLHLPASLEKIANFQQGLILLSGASGSGKSTTIAAILNYINETRPCHIVTIEDPIEYLFEDKKAIVSQREIGIDVDSYQTALKYLMREDPDVVLIGEMRDHETFTAALQATETGHLVLGTVHASTAAQTVGRVLELVGVENRDVFRQALVHNLRAIVCQKLLPSIAKGFGRVPAVEVLLPNATVRQLIMEKRESELAEAIDAASQEGMQSFTLSLLELIEKEYVDPRLAYEVAPNPDELKMKLRGISSSGGGLMGRG